MFFLDLTDTTSGVPFRVRYYAPGEFPANRNTGPNEGRVDFFDTRGLRTPDGTLIASYYDTSLLAHGEPLNWSLHTGMPDMTLDGPTINRVLKWLRDVSVYAQIGDRNAMIIPPTGNFATGLTGLIVAFTLTEWEGPKGEGYVLIRRRYDPSNSTDVAAMLGEDRAYSTHYVYTRDGGHTWFAQAGAYLMDRDRARQHFRIRVAW